MHKLLNKAGAKIETSYDEKSWQALDDEPSYVFRYQGAKELGSFFAVAARNRKRRGERYDPRDLGVIPEAIHATLSLIDKAGFEVVHLGPVASSRYHRAWHPLHPSYRSYRGVRKFISRSKVCNISWIKLHIEDPSVWYPVLAGKIPVSGTTLIGFSHS